MSERSNSELRIYLGKMLGKNDGRGWGNFGSGLQKGLEWVENKGSGGKWWKGKENEKEGRVEGKGCERIRGNVVIEEGKNAVRGNDASGGEGKWWDGRGEILGGEDKWRVRN